MRKEINIRKAMLSEARVIAEIGIKTWQVAYKDLLPAEMLSGKDIDKQIKKREEIISAYVNCWPGIYVAEVEDKVVGFLTIGNVEENEVVKPYIKNCAELLAIYVLPEYHKLGIGYALMNNAKKIFSDNGYKNFVLWCLKDNINSRRFYERQGGVCIGEMEKVLRDTMQTEVCYLYNLD